MKPYLRSTFVSTLSLLAALGCGEGDPSVPEDVQTLNEPLYFTTATTLWNGATTADTTKLGTGVTIPVCWAESPMQSGGPFGCPSGSATTDCVGQSFASSELTDMFTGSSTSVRNALREYIRTQIERTWMAVANIEFTGWGVGPKSNGQHRDVDLNGRIAIQLSQGLPAGG
jgi:hypothetical protein